MITTGHGLVVPLRRSDLDGELSGFKSVVDDVPSTSLVSNLCAVKDTACDIGGSAGAISPSLYQSLPVSTIGEFKGEVVFEGEAEVVDPDVIKVPSA